MIYYDSPLNFCTYLTRYSGNKLPSLYIGSTSYARIQNGYHGSVASLEYKQIWNDEIRNNPAAFCTEVLSFHETREEATTQERALHLEFNVVKNPNFINKALATPKGFFGMDVSGDKNPMFQKGHLLSGDKNGMFGVDRRSNEDTSKFGLTGENHPQFGKTGNNCHNFSRVWINNGAVQHNVKPEVLDNYLSNGFFLGQLPNRNVTCPHCHKTGRASALMYHWHFDNCKRASPIPDILT